MNHVVCVLLSSKFYKNIVNEKVDHIDNVVLGLLCLAISVIPNKISIQSMNHMIYEYRLLPDFLFSFSCHV